MWLRYTLAVFAQCMIAHAVSLGSHDLRTRTTTVADFASFGEEIGLSKSIIQALGDEFARASHPVQALAVACRTARKCLGEAQVETIPVDQTIVEINW
jgi:hypothetical protein